MYETRVWLTLLTCKEYYDEKTNTYEKRNVLFDRYQGNEFFHHLWVKKSS